ncbi:QcrA and Rieske domain-containing protein [Arcticibacterium luteifluviistationis]|uniref:(2Fe-2S)-binding protein n=1 Tax=Arcticibacterium luteifluviistationis TaxID=1784714 RepID=A0A2Z4GCJ9_9BACT|nr:Rieske 2Fe-2S domain-containing protein [Arcticibacterium luteifluviistationis]AWV98864.1 (2Fe-2S)-binding protein [Arcticibacterium luteifluviistationis]
MEKLVSTPKKKNTLERKEFMKQVGIGFGGILLMNCLQACSDSEIPDPMPGGSGDKVDITLDLNLTANNSLNTLGGFVVSGGVIVARTLDDNFIAVSSACTHQGTTINYRAAEKDFLCPLHLSEFSETGAVEKGPATSPLTRYNVTSDETANTVRIFE